MALANTPRCVGGKRKKEVEEEDEEEEEEEEEDEEGKVLKVKVNSQKWRAPTRLPQNFQFQFFFM